MDAQEFFDREWLSLAPRLSRYLGVLGVPAADRDDVVQEVALKLYRRWSLIDPSRSVEAYARTIAANHWRDILRTRAAHECVGEVPDVADTADVAVQAEARLELSRVAREIARLEPGQRAALLTEFTADSAPLSAAVRMARTRARRSLAVALRVASAAVAVAAASLRRLRARPVVGAGALVASVALLGAAGVPVLPPGLHIFGTERQRPPAGAGGGATAAGASQSWQVGDGTGIDGRGEATNDDAQPWTVDAGIAHAEMLLRLQLLGYGVGVEQRGGPPVCVYGAPDDPRLRSVECESARVRPAL